MFILLIILQTFYPLIQNRYLYFQNDSNLKKKCFLIESFNSSLGLPKNFGLLTFFNVC